MTRLVELRRDAQQQLWAHYEDGTVWPHGAPRFDEEAAGWAGMQRRWAQWLTQLERRRWAREVM